MDSIKGKLDDLGGSDLSSGGGQIMGYINEPTGRVHNWRIPLAESYGVRLPADYDGDVSEQIQLMDVPEGEPPAIALTLPRAGCSIFFHDPERFWKYVRPVKKV